MLKLNALLFTVLLVLCLTGCDTGSEPSPAPEIPQSGDAVIPQTAPEQTPSGQTEEPERVIEPEASSEISLQIMPWEEAAALVGKHPGKVVVMDLWSTTCPPCLRELPHFVELANSQFDKVKCISVSMDYAGFEDEPVESYQEPVLAVLKRSNATTLNILCSTDFNTVLGPILPHSSLPAVYVYNQSGELAGQFPDPANPAEFTYEADVVPLVEKLIGK